MRSKSSLFSPFWVMSTVSADCSPYCGGMPMTTSLASVAGAPPARSRRQSPSRRSVWVGTGRGRARPGGLWLAGRLWHEHGRCMTVLDSSLMGWSYRFSPHHDSPGGGETPRPRRAAKSASFARQASRRATSPTACNRAINPCKRHGQHAHQRQSERRRGRWLASGRVPAWLQNRRRVQSRRSGTSPTPPRR